MSSINSANYFRVAIFLAVFPTIHGKLVPFFLFPQTCHNQNCNKIDNHLKSSANNSHAPCTDFYKRVCENWSARGEKPRSEPFWNQYLATTYEINGKLQRVLAKTDGFGKNAKIFYENCADGENGEKYVRQLRNFAEKLGGWRNFSYLDYEPLRHVVEVTRLLNIHPILKFHVNTDYTNTTRNILYMEPGDLVFPESFLANAEKFREELQIYREWIRDTIAEIYNISAKNLEAESQNVVNFEIALAKIAEGEHSKRKMKVENLPVFGEKYWRNLFKLLLQNTKLQFYNIDEIVSKPNYLKKLFQLFAKTNLHTISNYVIWCVVKDLARETSRNLREINFRVDNKILKIEEDLDRKHECVQQAMKYFPVSLTEAYLDGHFDREIFRHVERMAENIRREFAEILQRNDWMSAKMKMWVVEKISRIRFEIGFSKHGNIEYAKELSRNHLLNCLRLKSFKSKISLEQLGESSKQIKWPIHPFEVNAYYSILQNAIILPLGILHPPFFDLRRPQVLNYGALGTLIGHEISHALDTNGRRGDKHGNLGDWWSPADLDAYAEKSKCFEEKYDAYGIDGGLTVGENVADNVGIALSFAAMLRDKDRGGPSVFRAKKLFFLSFGQLWCEISHGNELYVEEEHSPVEIRVLATLRNFDPFNYIYNCERGKICKLW